MKHDVILRDFVMFFYYLVSSCHKEDEVRKVNKYYSRNKHQEVIYKLIFWVIVAMDTKHIVETEIC